MTTETGDAIKELLEVAKGVDVLHFAELRNELVASTQAQVESMQEIHRRATAGASNADIVGLMMQAMVKQTELSIVTTKVLNDLLDMPGVLAESTIQSGKAVTALQGDILKLMRAGVGYGSF